MKPGLLYFVDFQEYGDFDYIENNLTALGFTKKKASPSKEYIFKIFKFECNTPKEQKIVLETFYQISNRKNQYILSYKQISFSSIGGLTPTFSMKSISRNTLENALKKPSIFSTWKIANIMECLFAVAEGMNYLHNHLICHGNLCPSNIIIDKADQFYICDFGLYPIKKLYIDKDKIFNDDYKDPYMSDNGPTFKNDVYSFGVLMCNLFHTYYQMHNNEQEETLREFLLNTNRNKYNKFPRFCSALIPACLNSFVSERPSFKQILDLFKSTEYDDEELSISRLYDKFTKSNYLTKLAIKNDSFALIKLGNMYEEGIVFKHDHAAAMDYYKRAAELNNSEAQNIYGVLLQYNEDERSAKELQEGAKYLALSAEQGNIHGMANYGVALLYGHGVAKNIQKAEEYLKKSADLGFSYAQVNYGFTLLDNNPTLSGISEGLQYIKKSMSQQDPDAYYTYAVLLQKGQFVEKSDELAMEYFRISSDLGDDRAMMEYAEGNLKGIGVPQNNENAIKYYQLAADNGNKYAKEIVAELSKIRQETEVLPKQSKIKTKRTFRKKQTGKELIKNELIENILTLSQSEPNSSQPTDQNSIQLTAKKRKSTKEQTPKRVTKKESITDLQNLIDTVNHQVLNQEPITNDLTSSSKEAKKGKSTTKKQTTLIKDEAASNEANSKKATKKASTKAKNILDQPFIATLARSSSTNTIEAPKTNNDHSNPITSPPAVQIPQSSQSFSFDQNQKDSNLPLQVSPKIKLISLGTIVFDKPGYHTDKYIYPVGYQIEKEFFSIDDPNKQAVYRATVLNGGDTPIFRVECLDRTNMVFEGNTPSKPWVDATQAIEESKKRLGMQQRGTFAISGPKYFGFALRNVMQMIEALPNADKCANYKFNRHSVCLTDEKPESHKEEEESNEMLKKLQKMNPLGDEKIILRSVQFNSEKQKQQQQPNLSLFNERSQSHGTFQTVQNDQQQNSNVNRTKSDSYINNQQQQNQNPLSGNQDQLNAIYQQYQSLLSVKPDPIAIAKQQQYKDINNFQLDQLQQKKEQMKQEQLMGIQQQLMQNLASMKQEPTGAIQKQSTIGENTKTKQKQPQKSQQKYSNAQLNMPQVNPSPINNAQQQLQHPQIQQFQNAVHPQINLPQVKPSPISNVQQQQQPQQYQNVQLNQPQVKANPVTNIQQAQQQQQQQQQQYQNAAHVQLNQPQIKTNTISNVQQQPQQYQNIAHVQLNQPQVKTNQVNNIQQQQQQQYQNMPNIQQDKAQIQPQPVGNVQQQFQAISNVQLKQENPVQLTNDQQYHILAHVEIKQPQPQPQPKPLQISNEQLQLLAMQFQNFIQSQNVNNEHQYQNIQQQTTINQTPNTVEINRTQVQQNEKVTTQMNQTNQNNNLLFGYLIDMLKQPK